MNGKKETTTVYGVVLAALAAGVLAGAVAAATKTQPAKDKLPTVDEIVAKTNAVSYYQGADGRAKVKMTIVDAQQCKRVREFTILRWDQPKPKAKADEKSKDDKKAKDDKKPDDTFTGEQKFYVYFHRPADLNRMVFLVWKHLEKDDDRWLFLPRLNLVNRIASNEKRTSFVGSDFFYEDVSGRNVNDDVHELLANETNKTYYVLKNTPKKPDSVEFAYFKMWIHRPTHLVVQTSYYDKQGKEYRRYKVGKVETIQGYPTVTKAQMTDLAKKQHTVLEYEEVKYDIGLPESLFTERHLKSTPHEYLK